MKNSWAVVALVCTLIINSAFSSPKRAVRSVGERVDQNELAREIVFPRIADAMDDHLDTLSYEDPDEITNFLNMPNGLGDMYYNVRYTPLNAPYQIFAVHLPLFDMWGEMGEPGMEVSIWESGVQDEEYGYPTEMITTVTVEFEDLIFSSTDEDPVFNIIDLSNLNIAFNDEVDFHIAINLIPSGSADSNGVYDTLGIYMDDGLYVEDSRSGLSFSEEEGEEFPWVKLQDIEEYGPFNFAIHAVVGPPVSVSESEIGLLSPNSLMVNPAFPNPFNEYTTVKINVPFGLIYSAQLIDQSGRLMQNISEGVGSGTSLINIHASNYPAGSYYLKLSSAHENKLVQLIYLK